MINKLLLPRICRIIGLMVLPLSVALLIGYYNYNVSFDFLKVHPNAQGQITSNILAKNLLDSGDVIFTRNFSADYTGTVAMVLTFAALFMIAFSKEKHEDEYVSSLRLKALQISVYANYIILALAAIALFEGAFLMVMELNLFTILIIFILVFYFNLRIRPAFSKTVSA